MVTLNQVAVLKNQVLSSLYERCTIPEVPDGDANGVAIFGNGTIIGELFSLLANMVWRGKVFTRERPGYAALVNKILGLKFVHAEVFRGKSWSDGGDAIIIDYLKTSFIAFYIRDEIRMIEPGLYLGKAYIRLPFGYRFCALYFALDFRSA